jgi:hypothetical protein
MTAFDWAAAFEATNATERQAVSWVARAKRFEEQNDEKNVGRRRVVNG